MDIRPLRIQKLKELLSTNYTKETKQKNTHRHTQTHTGPHRTKPLLANSKGFQKAATNNLTTIPN